MTLLLRVGLLMSLVFLPTDLFAAQSTTQRLIAKGDRNFPPYEFINAAGQPDGFDIDLLKAISRQMKMDVDIGLDTWETVREELNTGKIHMATGMIRFQKELERQIIEAQKLEAMGRLAGGVAHDFGNIVTGICGYAELIKTQPKNGEPVADWTEKILTGCERATDLVHYFLATAGRCEPEKQWVRLGQLVAEVFKLLQPTYGVNITFNNAIDSDNDAVWVEPALVFQVLMNLCVNGAQAMSENGGVLTVGLKDHSTVTALGTMEGSTPAPQLALFVEDTGPGIDPQVKERIFEPFFTTKGRQKGTGIGLYVVSQATSDMGGTIRVDSVLGKGTTFIVTLPAAC